MAEFDPLEWELRFKNIDQGAALEVAISKLKRLNVEILKTTQNINQIPSLKNAFSGIPSGIKTGRTGASAGAGFSLRPNLPAWMTEGPKPSMGAATSSSSMSSLGLSGLGSAAGAATAAITALAYAGYKTYNVLMDVTDSMVKVFSERESSLRTYTMLTGSLEEAKKQYFREAALAQKTELTQTDVRGFSSRLITAGFRDDALERARMNIADLVTMKPVHMRTASSNQLAELYSKVQGAGYVQEGLINRTASRFVQTKLIYDEIAKSLQIKPEGVRDALKKRQVTSDVFFDAFQKASMKQLNEKKLGEFATLSAGSLGGLLSNLDEAQENLLRTIDPSKIEGVDAYKKAIEHLTTTITAGTKSGDDLRYFLEDVADLGTNLKAIGLDTTSSFLESFGSEYRATMKELGMDSSVSKGAMSELDKMMKELGKGVGELVAPAVAKLVKGFYDAIPAIKNFTSFLGDLYDFISEVASVAWDLLPTWDVRKLSKELGINDDQTGKANLAGVHSVGTIPAVGDSKKDRLSKEIYTQQNTPMLPKDIISGEMSGSTSSSRGGGGGKEQGTAYMWRDMGLPPIRPEYTSIVDPYQFPSLEIYRDRNESAAKQMSAYSKPERKVEVSEINIIVNGEGLSPEQIGDAVLTKLSQTFERLSTAPSPGGI